jgi:hypothetical protein
MAFDCQVPLEFSVLYLKKYIFIVCPLKCANSTSDIHIVPYQRQVSSLISEVEFMKFNVPVMMNFKVMFFCSLADSYQFLQNVGTSLPDYMGSHPRRL